MTKRLVRAGLLSGLAVLAGCGGAGFDEDASYTVTPVSAEVAASNNGSAWDLDNSPPDVMMTLSCAGGQSTNTSTVESYQPAWGSGGCAATGRALRDSGIVWRLDDVDVTTNDTITANVPTLFPESVISSGEGQVSNVNAAIKVTFRITKN